MKVAAWTKAHPEKKKARQIAFRLARPTYDSDWRKANPEKRRASKAARRAREKFAQGTYSDVELKRLFELQRGKCAVCGEALGPGYHADHILPLFLGGINTIRNIQLLHPKCNIEKSRLHPIDFMRRKGFLL